jgi:REP element-mobilizing transposase RayT
MNEQGGWVMTRPLRLEFSGALYHVLSRGNRRESIYLNDGDFTAFLALLAEVCERFNWLIHAYCLMTNHYHLLIETPDANLSRGMRHLNGVYTQRFNRRHRRVGHVFQGRYKALLVQKDAYLLELTRYIVLNPVRARMVQTAGEWRWSNYRYTVGKAVPPTWLEMDWLLAQFGNQRSEAVSAYRRFVAEGLNAGNPFANVEEQLFLGDDAFASRLRDMQKSESLSEISPAHRRALALSLEEYSKLSTSRDEAMACAYLSGAYKMREIADHFGVHYMTVSRAVRRKSGMFECET